MRFVVAFAAIAPVALAAELLAACSRPAPVADFPDPPNGGTDHAQGPQIAVLAGGCFWGMEGVFERLKGVSQVLSGYSGGNPSTAHYEMVATGTTGHAESIQVTYDPSVISYGTLLKVFFSVAHDPTELNYQGPDSGSQYRSSIFYANEEQKQVAESYISLLESRHIFPQPIVTKVVPLLAFYPAEDYHQKFYDKNPDYPYILIYDRPKVMALLRTYASLVMPSASP